MPGLNGDMQDDTAHCTPNCQRELPFQQSTYNARSRRASNSAQRGLARRSPLSTWQDPNRELGSIPKSGLASCFKSSKSRVAAEGSGGQHQLFCLCLCLGIVPAFCLDEDTSRSRPNFLRHQLSFGRRDMGKTVNWVEFLLHTIHLLACCSWIPSGVLRRGPLSS